MAELNSFFDANMVNGVPDRQYDATAWANYFSGFIGNGVSNSPASNLQVTAGTGLSVIVDSGIGYINGYYYNNTEPLTLNINTANATYPRITSIVIELNLNNREITCKAIDGNAQSNPTAPQITQTESTYQLQLGTVYIPAGATNIGTITDTRGIESVCGYVQMKVSSEIASFVGYQLALLNPNYYNQVFLPESIQWANSNINGLPILGGIHAPETMTTPCNIVHVGPGENHVNVIIDGEFYGDNGQIPLIDSIKNLQDGNFKKPLQGISLEGTTHNNGEIYGGNITEALITASTIEQPTINGGGMNKVAFEGVCKNNGIIFGGSVSGATINQPTINGGGWNDIEIAGVGKNNGTIEGGTYIAPNISGGNYDNPTFSGIANNNGTINGGTISNVTINNTNLEGTINNFTTINGGTLLKGVINDCQIWNGTLGNVKTIDNFNISGGAQAMGENLVQYENIPFSVLISTGVTLSGTCEFWLLNGPNLTGESINGAIGVMTVTGSVNSTYTWETDNHFPVDLSQIPNMTAITQTPFAPFQIGAGTGTMYLKGNNRTLNAGTTYTVQALAFQ